MKYPVSDSRLSELLDYATDYGRLHGELISKNEHKDAEINSGQRDTINALQELQAYRKAAAIDWPARRAIECRKVLDASR